jgi:hypothetical protein
LHKPASLCSDYEFLMFIPAIRKCHNKEEGWDKKTETDCMNLK